MHAPIAVSAMEPLRRRESRLFAGALALIWLWSCAKPREVKKPDAPPRDFELLESLTLYDVSRSARRVLFDGRPERWRTEPKTISSEYAVWNDHDLLLVLDEAIINLNGAISIRARILDEAKTEIPVENYTVINDKEIKEERKALFADETELFRGPDDDALIAQLLVLQNRASHYRALLYGAPVSGLRNLYPGEAFDKWLAAIEDETARPALTAQAGVLSEHALESAAASLASLHSDELVQSKQALIAALADVEQRIEKQFVVSRLTDQLDDSNLSSVRDAALRLIRRISVWRSRLESAGAPDVSAFEACTASLFEATATFSAKALDGGDVTFGPGERLWVDELNKNLSLVRTPKHTAAFTLDPTKVKRVDARQHCYEFVFPSFWRSLGTQLEVLIDITKRPDEISLPPDCRTAEAPEHDDMSPLQAVEELRRRTRCGITARLKRGLLDARIRLAPLQLKHGDRIEITVRLTRPGTSIDPSVTETPSIEAEERFVVRVVQGGVEFRASPQFGLVKRFSDIRAATATESPSNFKPAAGINFSVRFHHLKRWTDWVLPSLGIAAHTVDFDPNKTFELGVGGSLGLLDDHVHVGTGVNVSVDKHRGYWWFSLDFLRTVDTFSSLFGG